MIKIVFCLLLFVFYNAGCSSCHRGEGEPTRVSSKTLALSDSKKEAPPPVTTPSVKVINIGPSREMPTAPLGPSDLPAEVVINDKLTDRLREKMGEAFEGKGTAPPNVEIYTGTMNLDGLSKYYEDKGYKIQRTSVPASQVIAPLLRDKPELAGKISLGNYAGVVINQIIVEGANISAADKYIDPETYEIVYKTFVTVTRMK